MVHRSYWINLLEDTWKRKSVIWLSGVRRAGKTYLCRSLPDIDYFDCELPRTRQALRDPESFLEDHKDRRIIIDEIHRLDNPSELLKIAADYHPDTKVIATGSSTLGASTKFRDTLAGRKAEVWLTPMILTDMSDFENTNLEHRFLRGGLPPFFIDPNLPEREYQEWVDAYWAKDIQELFRLERRQSFLKFAELLMVHSGGIFEATKYATICEVSRGTITNYLGVMEATFLAHVIRPFTSHRPTEIVLSPKVYALDTGFVCYFKGITSLRNEDMGLLWEHFVLNELHARLQMRDIQYWRDKRGHELDFVIAKRSLPPTAIECKWSAGDFDPTNLRAFRRIYPEGENLVVAHDAPDAYSRNYDGLKVRFVSLSALIESVKSL